MWSNTIIEKECETALITLDDSISNSNKFFENYLQSRTYFCKEIYPNIARIEPDLTDHGESHIQDVLINVYSILEDSYELSQEKYNKYTPLELYVLCMAVLIHDIGNLHHREGHEKTLTKIFNPRIFPHIDRAEMKIITDIAKAHGGKGDTIAKLSTDQLYGKRINSQCIAAVVRFADELAEGPQRTSQYMIDNGMISEDSIVYHHYASILKKPAICQNNIILEYNVFVDEYSEVELISLLQITFKRIDKLNYERIYCGCYSEHIQKLQKVVVQMNFYENQESFDPIQMETNQTKYELTNLDCKETNPDDIQKYVQEIISVIKLYSRIE